VRDELAGSDWGRPRVRDGPGHAVAWTRANSSSFRRAWSTARLLRQKSTRCS